MKKEYKGLVISIDNISFEDVLSESNPEKVFGDLGQGIHHGDYSDLLK